MDVFILNSFFFSHKDSYECGKDNSIDEVAATLSTLTVDDIWNQYENELAVKGKILSTSSEIMKTIAQKMGKTTKAAYLMLKRKYEKTHPEKKVDKVPAGDEIAKIVDDQLQNFIERAISVESFSKTFTIEESIIFETETRKTKHRNRETEKVYVKPGWTSKLALFLWKETNLSCKFDLKVAYVTQSKYVTQSTIKVKAGCACGSVLDVSCQQGVLSVDIKNINKNFQHKRRYQATGEMKKGLSEALKYSSALKVQTNKINDFIPDNDTLKTEHVPVMQTLNTLRVIKCLDKVSDEDPMDTLLEWKETIFKNVISFVSHSPFTVHYRTPLQRAWYIAQSKKCRMSGSVDATGSVVIPPRRSLKIEGSDKLKHVFLYTVMAKNKSKSVPVGQMITQDQSSENIEFFFKKMFKFPLKPLDEFVCDESKALLKALISTYTTCEGLETYIEQCMSSLQTGAPPPKCQIRLDRSHFVKNVAKKITYRDHRKRFFYRCVVGYLITCDDFNITKKILSDFFTIMLNEYDGVDEFNAKLPAEISKVRLTNLGGTHNEYPDYAEESNEWSEDSEVDVNTQWIDDIIKKVPIVETGHHLNVLYSGSDKGIYVKLFSTIVLWSNVMNNSFGSTAAVATSSDVESSFNSLKNGILAGKMLKAHTFVKTHVEFVNAEVKLNAICTSNQSEEPPKRKRSNSMTESSPLKIRKRSNSNQYEQSHCTELFDGNGKNKKLELYNLVDSTFI